MIRYVIAAALAITVVAPASALTLNAESYVVYHPDTQTVLFEKNPDQQIAPASLTKMMTVYLLFDAIRRGELTPDSDIPVSEKAWRKGGSKMFIEVGKAVRVEDLIQGILVSSGNDACIAVAEFLGGTEQGFATMMNDIATDLGMTNTTFANASGWPDITQLTTARDMVTLATALIAEFPEYYRFFSIDRFSYNGISQPNRNGLLARGIGVDGMKTGHVEEAGYHLASSAERDGVRLVSVVMGASSQRAREQETASGLTYAFRTFETVPVVSRGETVVTGLPVEMADALSVDLIAGRALAGYFNKREQQPFTTTFNHPEKLLAPLRRGQEVGTLTVTFNSDGRTFDVPLLVAEDRPALSGFSAVKRKIQMMFGG